ncbi:hypothetical protein ID866_3135 [Astraeus odoratus]|nr:hypothetical protein ID866_3135 [Astraeus odoratus]
MENNLCPGCKKSAVNECGGLVVAFGQSFFHVDCFKCAKCNEQVIADTNLLLLSDGSPICANCSYNCNICQQPILDEAIMTGDDSYHAHCFKCKVCHNRIDELVFAKTSQGIYCMACHNERMAKIRRHAQRKREKEKAASGSGSSSTRERDARERLADSASSDRSQSILSTPASLRSKSSTGTFRETRSVTSADPSTPVRKRKSLPPADETPTATKSGSAFTASRHENGLPDHQRAPSPSLAPDPGPSQAFSMIIAPPEADHHCVDEHGILINNGRSPSDYRSNGLNQGDSGQSAGYLQVSPPDSSATHLSPSFAGGSKNVQRRKSYDDGVRPLNFLFGKKGTNQEPKNLPNKPPSPGLVVPNGSTSRSEKRRSINPGLAVSTTVAPDMVRSHTLPVQRTDSPTVPSGPSSDISSARSPSNSSSFRDNASISTVYHSPSSSPTLLENGRATPDSVRMRTISYDPHYSGPQSAPPPARPGTPLRNALHPGDAVEPVRVNGFGNASYSLDGGSGHSAHDRLSPAGPSARRPARMDGLNADFSSPPSWNDRSGLVSPASPSHVADVPHGIESGTDTEAEADYDRPPNNGSVTSPRSLPAPAPKETKPKTRPSDLRLEKLDADPDVSAVSQFDGSDESSPVERTSVATFIAPALPPIRFSMSGSDFSDFLKSVGGLPPLRSLNEISESLKDDLQKASSAITGAPVVGPLNDQSNVHGSFKPGKSLGLGADASPPSVRDALKDESEAKDTVPNMTREFPSRGRAASESLSPTSAYGHGTSERKRLDSNASLNVVPSTTRIAFTLPEPTTPTPVVNEAFDTTMKGLQESIADANENGLQQLTFDRVFVETILTAMEQRRGEYNDLKARYDGTKRTSHQYILGLSVAQKEYDRELVARRNAEAEVIRLRVLLSGQAAKLTALSGESNRQEARKQMSEELSKNLDRLEKDLSKLKVERDLTLAEMEELCSSKSVSPSGEVPAAQISRSLTMRLDNLRSQYQRELTPLIQQREALVREIAELKAAREQFLEETTVLNARNEELAQLSAQYVRRMEAARSETSLQDHSPPPREDTKDVGPVQGKKSASFDRARPVLETPVPVAHSLSTSSTQSTIATLAEDRETKVNRTPKPDQWDAVSTLKHGKFIKWPGSRAKEATTHLDSKAKMHMEHNFQQASTLRFIRCDHCGEKLWGASHLRCSSCHISVHSRCMSQVQLICAQQPRHRDEVVLPPSMFGRELIEQVKSDCRWGERKVPIIVEKCIEAVEAVALDYEGIYRKSGGNGQTKIITQLFERQDYTAFDLRDTNRFNDICSVTSVLKMYFRSLPVPLLTFDLHEDFICAAGLRDNTLKAKQIQELMDRLPSEHYYTLRLLVLHLHRVREHSDTNLMTARNLGLVFGPTLMWSRDPGSEFSDMAGKALMVEWLVENATSIFAT